MTDGPGLDLGHPRNLGALLRDSLAILRRHLGAFLAISVAVVVPVQLAVLGVGLEQISGPYDENTGTVEIVIPAIVSFFVIAPLMTATVVHAIGRLENGEPPRAGASLQEGLEDFTPLFLAVLIAAAGIAAGLALLVVPGIYLLVRFYFVPQAVAMERRRGLGALERSGELVRGNWLKVFGTILLVNLLAAVPGILILTPVDELARSADSQLVSLAGNVLVDTLVTPFVALVSTLLFLDLRARKALEA